MIKWRSEMLDSTIIRSSVRFPFKNINDSNTVHCHNRGDFSFMQVL